MLEIVAVDAQQLFADAEVCLYHVVEGSVPLLEPDIAHIAGSIAGNIEYAGRKGGFDLGAQLFELAGSAELFDKMYKAAMGAKGRAHLGGKTGNGVAVEVEREVNGIGWQKGQVFAHMPLPVEGKQPGVVIFAHTPLAQCIYTVLIVVVTA